MVTKNFYKDLAEFISIPSISSDEARTQECLEAAKWLINYLEKGGADRAELWDSQRLPIVYAEIQANQKTPATTLFYGHYDVQPAGEGWSSPPFELTEKNNNLYARGIADDKGQMLLALQTILELKSQGKLAYNIKILIEGEEEVGSPHIPAVIAARKAELQADSLLVLDCDMPRDRAQFFLGLRGMLGFQLQLINSASDLHSGAFGGFAYNPVTALVQLLDTVVSADGEVKIPGFYDGINFANSNYRELAQAKDQEYQQLQKHHQIGATFAVTAYSPAEMASIRPTFEINAIHAGAPIEQRSTIIPSVATANITCRLVPGQDPAILAKLIETRFKELLDKKVPKGMKMELRFTAGEPAVEFSQDSPILISASEVAKTVWDNPPIYSYSGGTIGVLAGFKKQLNLDGVITGFAHADAGIHGKDEHMPIVQFQKGKEFLKGLLGTA